MNVHGHIGTLAALTLAVTGLTLATASANPVTGTRATVRLAAEFASIQPGQPFDVAIQLELEPGWHTYWKNPGDSGIPIEVAWQLPAGFEAGPILWPVPTRHPEGDYMTFGYAGEVTLLARIATSDGIPVNRLATLGVEVRWLACLEACEPGKATVRLAVPVSLSPPVRARDAADLFARARARLPREPAGWTFRAEADPDEYRLIVTPPADFDPAWMPKGIFFPDDNELIRHAYRPQWSESNGRWRLRLPSSGIRPAPARVIRGLLAFEAPGGPIGLPVVAPVIDPESGTVHGHGAGTDGN